jgi:hypothetical protein
MAREKKKFLPLDKTSNNYTILLLRPGRVEMCRSGVKGNLYAPFVREEGQATALPYLTYKGGEESSFFSLFDYKEMRNFNPSYSLSLF